jgi:hypothetical protein
MVSLTPRPALPPGRKFWCPLNGWLDEGQGQSGRFEDEKIRLILPVIERRTVNPIAYTDYHIQNNTVSEIKYK